MLPDEVPQNIDTPQKKSREKSVKYPFYSLKECLDYLSTIHEIAGKKEAPVESVLSRLNITSKNNRRFSYLTSSAEIFGLIEKTNVGLKPTEMGTLILYPPNGEVERKKLLGQAFKLPILYQKVIERYDKTILPNNDILKNIFYNLGIARIVLDNAVSSFLESAQYAGVLDSNNRLNVSDIETSNETQKPQQQEPVNSIKLNQAAPPSETPPRTDVQEVEIGYDKFEITTSTGKKASIILPTDISKQDIDRLKKHLGVYFDPE